MHIYMHVYKRAYRVPMLSWWSRSVPPRYGKDSDSKEKFPGGLIEMQNLGELLSGQDSRTPNVRT